MAISHFARRALLLCVLLAGQARADLMLFPTRVVFDKNLRAAQVELINNGSEPATYRLSLVNRRMAESGEFTAIDTHGAGELFAEPMLRFSPRQVTVQPGASQTVRLMLRKPAELVDGEYRSHLQFDRLPDVAGASSIESKAAAEQGIGVQLSALIGASMPVIVRHGATSASVTLSQLEMNGKSAAPALSMLFERSGSASVYGDLTVTFTPRGGREQHLAKMGGVAVYTPNTRRRANLPLQVPAGVALANGTLQVSYRERADAGGAVLAQASLALP